jgi:hypothetical protein
MAHVTHAEPLTALEATQEIRARFKSGGSVVVMIVLAILAAIGLVLVLGRITSGPLPYTKWAYPAITLAFLASTAQAMPMVAFATRLAKGYWALPIRRIAELGALSGLVTTPLFIVLLNQLPPYAPYSVTHRPTIWFDWPLAPVFYDSVMMILLTITGLMLVYFSSRPDRAILKGTAGKTWFGTGRQWDVTSLGVLMLGAFYLMVYTFTHWYIVSDLGISLVPGWRSAIFPPYHAISGLQAGLASVLLVAGAMRKFGGLSRFIGLDVFWGASKLLIGLSLLFFYFTWSELILYWYGRTPDEQFLLDLFMFGPYLALFILSVAMNFVIPIALLMWNPIRKSIRGPIAVATIIFFGNMIDRIRIYSAAWSIPNLQTEHLLFAPPALLPDITDILVFVGGIAAVALIYLIALRFVPAIALWEFKSGLLLREEQPFLKTEVAVVAKPR